MSDAACVFARALLARQMGCACATRSVLGEQLRVGCAQPAAQHNCRLLWRLAYERSRFALKLPAEGQPLPHRQAMRLQCGTLLALRDCVAPQADDVHQLLAAAHAAHGSLTELPWSTLVPALAAWQAPRRGGPA